MNSPASVHSSKTLGRSSFPRPVNQSNDRSTIRTQYTLVDHCLPRAQCSSEEFDYVHSSFTHEVLLHSDTSIRRREFSDLPRMDGPFVTRRRTQRAVTKSLERIRFDFPPLSASSTSPSPPPSFADDRPRPGRCEAGQGHCVPSPQ